MLDNEPLSKTRKDLGEKRFRAVFTADAASDGMTGFYRDVLRSTGCHR